MKNKICLLLLLSLTLFIFTSCENEDDSSFISKFSSNDSSQDIEEHIIESHGNINTNLKESELKSFTEKLNIYLISNANNFRTTGDFGMYGGDNYTTSIVYDNMQLLQNDFRKKLLENDDFFDNFKLKTINDYQTKHILSKDYYTNDSTDYDKLTDEDIIIQYIGDFTPIENKVKYTNYFYDEALPKDFWNKLIVEQLDKKMLNKYKASLKTININPPIIYKESWEYYDGDTSVQVVVASNVLDDEDILNLGLENNIYPDNSSQEKSLLYKITLIIMNDKVINCLANIELINNENFQAPQERDVPVYAYYSYQYNGDEIAICPTYFLYNSPISVKLMFAYNSYMFANIDMDSDIEMVQFSDTISTSWGIIGVVSHNFNETGQINTILSLEVAGA